MKAQSNQYPSVAQYDSQQISVPINIVETVRGDETIYEYDMMLISADENPGVRECLKQAIKQYHADIISAGYLTSMGFRVDIEQSNVVDWSAALQLLQLSGATETEVCDYDNQTHVLTVEQYTQMCGEMGLYLTGLRSKKWAIRNAIDAAENDDLAYGVAFWS